MTTYPSFNATVEELRADVERLWQENADLRASALLWKRLYEQALPDDTRAELESIDQGPAEKSRHKSARIEQPPELSTVRPSGAAALRIARR